MVTDCSDVCDTLYSLMCAKCPIESICMPIEDQANNDQMIECLCFITERLKGNYPNSEGELIYPYEE